MVTALMCDFDAEYKEHIRRVRVDIEDLYATLMRRNVDLIAACESAALRVNDVLELLLPYAHTYGMATELDDALTAVSAIASDATSLHLEVAAGRIKPLDFFSVATARRGEELLLVSRYVTSLINWNHLQVWRWNGSMQAAARTPKPAHFSLVATQQRQFAFASAILGKWREYTRTVEQGWMDERRGEVSSAMRACAGSSTAAAKQQWVQLGLVATPRLGRYFPSLGRERGACSVAHGLEWSAGIVGRPISDAARRALEAGEAAATVQQVALVAEEHEANLTILRQNGPCDGYKHPLLQLQEQRESGVTKGEGYYGAGGAIQVSYEDLGMDAVSTKPSSLRELLRVTIKAAGTMVAHTQEEDTKRGNKHRTVGEFGAQAAGAAFARTDLNTFAMRKKTWGPYPEPIHAVTYSKAFEECDGVDILTLTCPKPTACSVHCPEVTHCPAWRVFALNVIRCCKKACT